jgi:hypothetical protein
MWKFWVTIVNAHGKILNAEVKVDKQKEPTEVGARRAIIHDCMASGGHVVKIETAGVQLE